jgi:hypothetical protein
MKFLAPGDPEVAVVDWRGGEGEAAEKAVTLFLVEMVLDSTIADSSWYERVPWTKGEHDRRRHRRSRWERSAMKIGKGRNYLVAAALAAAAGCGGLVSSFAQEPKSAGSGYGEQPGQEANPGDPGYGEQLVKAVLASPGVLGIELGQTTKGRRVIFAWFENKRALVDWYQSDFHERGVKWAFPNLKSVREPLPDLPEDSGQILALVSLKFADKSTTGAAVSRVASRPAIESIGIELYTPLPGGVAVGGRFAPKSVRVPGLREFDMSTAEGRSP